MQPTPQVIAAPPAPSTWARVAAWFGRRSTYPSARTPRRPLPQLGDYALQQVVSRHDRTTVYRAVQQASGQMVALKTVRLGEVDPTDRAFWKERFLREAEAASRLRHPDIVRLLAGGVQGTDDAMTGWLAMEWVPGADLTRYAAAPRLLPELLVLSLVARVALALGHAHSAGVIHRDIKPGNILFDPSRGAVKVTDFGSARLVDAIVTRSGMFVGTPAYMAPEQLAGAEATPQSDLYSLGVVLFELLAGRRPFEADSMGDLLALIAHQAVPSLTAQRPELPGLLDDILRRLLAKQPEQRHPTGQQLALELRMALAQCAAPEPQGLSESADSAWGPQESKAQS